MNLSLRGNGRMQSVCSVAALAGMTLFIVGCGVGDTEYQTVTDEDATQAEAHVDDHDHDHDHHHDAPHGGHLIELGEHQYNAELTFDAAAKELVVYLLDAHAKDSIPIEGNVQFKPEEGEPVVLEPKPQEGDPEGQSSRFVAGGDAAASYADIEAVHGNVVATIKGKEFVGVLSHDHDHGHDHDDHDHDHGKEGHKHDDDHKHGDGDKDE